MYALTTRGSYELLEKLWATFFLTARRVNADLAWTHDEVVKSSVKLPVSIRFISHLHCYSVLVDHLDWNVAPNIFLCCWMGSSSTSVQPRV